MSLNRAINIFCKKFIIVIIFNYYFLFNAFSKGFSFGPKIIFGGNDTNNIVGNTYNTINKNLVVKSNGYKYNFGFHFGYNFEIQWFSFGLVLEVTYYYSHKLLLMKKKVPKILVWDHKNIKKLSNIGVNAFHFPLLLKFSIPILKIYLGPRIRYLFYINEKKAHKNFYSNNTDKYQCFYFDLYFRILLGIERWGVEACLGFECFKDFGKYNQKLDYLYEKNKLSYSLIALISYDILSFINVK